MSTSLAVYSETLEELNGWNATSDCNSHPQDRPELRDCSIIIPTYSRPKEVIALLEHIAANHASDLPGELVIVDGSPNDATERALKEWINNGASLRFTLKYVHSRPGLTRQKNVGIDISSGNYLFFLDDDTLPLPGYFREMRAIFACDEERKIGAIGGSISNEMNRPVSFRWRIRMALHLVPGTEPMRYDAAGISLPKALAKPFSGIREVDIVPGGASCFRREVFSTSRFSMFFDGYSNGEDVEMSLRVGKRFRLLWSGDAQLRHNHAPGGRPTSFSRGRMDVRNRLFIRRRFWPKPPLKASVRFWADVLLLMLLDLIVFCRRPYDTFLVRHAAGLAWASVEAMLAPPFFEEPPARREYVLRGTAS